MGMEGLSEILKRREELMNEKFDYVILSEQNEWLATGTQATQKELDTDLGQLKAENPNVELVVYKANKMETFTY